MPLLRLIFGLVFFVALSACGSTKGVVDRIDDEVPSGVEVEMDRDKLAEAAQAPLYDLNLKRVEIPVELRVLDNLYAEPRLQKCRHAQYEVDQLTRVLGPDPAEESRMPTARDKTYTIDTADQLSDAISGLIPYNDVIRYLSGASENEKKFAEALFRGQIRRAFLKGWMTREGCGFVPTPSLKPVR